MTTTIQISDKLKKELNSRKLYQKETYEEIIWEILQDIKDLDEQTRVEMAIARGDIKSGNYYGLSEAKKQIGI
jgi:hypothetical protein